MLITVIKEQIKMEIKFGKKEMVQVIESYYKKYEDFEGKVTAGCKSGWVGYGMAERQDAVVSIGITGNLSVEGILVPMVREVTYDEVFNIFKTVLGNQGYYVNNVTLDSGVNDVCEGYGMVEHTVKKPCFKGVIVGVTEKKLVK